MKLNNLFKNETIRPYLWIKPIGWILLVLSVGFALVAFSRYRSDRRFIDRAQRLEGRVTGFDEYRHDKTARQEYAPVLRYRTGENEREYHTHFYSYDKDFDLGEEVIVDLDPQYPEVVLLDVFRLRWLAILILGGVSLISVILGLVMVLIDWESW